MPPVLKPILRKTQPPSNADAPEKRVQIAAPPNVARDAQMPPPPPGTAIRHELPVVVAHELLQPVLPLAEPVKVPHARLVPMKAKNGQRLYAPRAAEKAVDLFVLQNTRILAKLERSQSAGLAVVQEVEQVANRPKTPFRKETVRETDALYVRKKSVSENVFEFFDAFLRPPRVSMGIVSKRRHSTQK
jgi:hypothetical protein